MTVDNGRTALVVCYSVLENDPRVVRQIEWLIDAGWSVDALGFGETPNAQVRAMYRFGRSLRSTATRALVHLFCPASRRFRLLVEPQLPASLLHSGSRYDLILVNEIDLLPWFVENSDRLLSTRAGSGLHLDLHEFHVWEARGAIERILAVRLREYHRWIMSHVASASIASRSTVAPGIAELYAYQYGIDSPLIVRNSPAFVDQRPSAVDAENIQLIYHGFSDLRRGLALLIEAMHLIEDRFTLTLMLTGPRENIEHLRNLARGLGERVRFVAAVPMSAVATTINGYDLEVIFFPPVTQNLRFTLPNKLFESVQGRLGLVIGPSVDMQSVLDEFHNGVVVDGWSTESLAATINSLTGENIQAFKAGSDAAASELCAERESEHFFAAIGSDEHKIGKE